MPQTQRKVSVTQEIDVGQISHSKGVTPQGALEQKLNIVLCTTGICLLCSLAQLGMTALGHYGQFFSCEMQHE